MKKTLALAAAAAFASAAFASAPPGNPAPTFTLSDLDGKPASLADYKGRIVVLEWNNFGCPFVQKHYRSGNMQALQKRYGKDVVWLTVNSTTRSSPDYSAPADLESTLAKFGAQPARYLMDDPGRVGRSYGAKTTPHMFVIDQTGTLIYAGGIDDKPSTDPADVATARNHVDQALTETLAGKPVTVATSTPYGCSVKY
jgi:hypothetical protein